MSGEHALGLARDVAFVGSSPRERGAHLAELLAIADARIIPA